MDLDFWWLLVIPVAFALGWMAARYDLKTLLSESANLPRSYFRGLNFLLNEQPDQAIDAFIEVVKLDPETIELHFALGNLFRRRGETDRAIRVHQNLLSRADLPVSRARPRALRARAGLPEGGPARSRGGNVPLARSRRVRAGRAARAPDHLRDREGLGRSRSRRPSASRTMGARVARQGNRPVPLRTRAGSTAAQESATRRAPNSKLALAANPKNVRATILVGDVDAAAGDARSGDRAAGGASRSRIAAYLPLVAEKLMNALRARSAARPRASIC